MNTEENGTSPGVGEGASSCKWVSVSCMTLGGVAPATPDDDYDPTPRPNSVTFSAGDAESSHCVTLNIVGDSNAEPEEAFTITAIAESREIKFPSLAKSAVIFTLDCKKVDWQLGVLNCQLGREGGRLRSLWAPS